MASPTSSCETPRTTRCRRASAPTITSAAPTGSRRGRASFRSSTRSSATTSSRRTPTGSSSPPRVPPSLRLPPGRPSSWRLAGRRALARDDAHAAANLLGRAAALRPGDAALLVDRAEAYFKFGDFSSAEDMNAAAIAAAEETGDARSAIAARLASSLIGLLVRAEGGVDEVADEINRALPTFEAAGDDATVARLAHTARGRVLVALPDRPDGGGPRTSARARPPRRRSQPRVERLDPARASRPWSGLWRSTSAAPGSTS